VYDRQTTSSFYITAKALDHSSMPTADRRWTVLIPVLCAFFLIALWMAGNARPGSGSDSLVVYCAHDFVYADQILKEFERQSGIHVDVRYDTEATKSLGLINLIVQERRHPRCDVFWNNEMLGTLDLQTQGLLEPYAGIAWNRLPQKYRDPDGGWIGFGARLRVVAVNAQQVAADPQTVQKVLELETSKAAIAKPLFGTTLTHYTVLWHEWGPERLKDWHAELRLRGIREVNGNGPVKDVVAQGICEVGFTDTDDVFVAIDDKLPVAMLPVRIKSGGNVQLTSAASARESTNKEKFEEPEGLRRSAQNVIEIGDVSTGSTVCIPNTAAIIRGSKHMAAAQKLIDFLGSAETELALACSKSRQVPLGPVDETLLPDEVRQMKSWADEGYDLRPLLPARRECLEWLKSEYAR